VPDRYQVGLPSGNLPVPLLPSAFLLGPHWDHRQRLGWAGRFLWERRRLRV